MDFRVLVARLKDFAMGKQEPRKFESEGDSLPARAEEHGPVKEVKEAPFNDSANEKSSVLVSEKVADPPAAAKYSWGSDDRDAVLAKVEAEKRCALIKAWEENEKAKAENKAHKKLSAIGPRERIKREYVEAKIKKFEGNVEKKKAEYAEKMKNKVAELHKAAEEKKAMIKVKKGEDCLKAEETAAKFRATGYAPGNCLGCLSV